MGDTHSSMHDKSQIGSVNDEGLMHDEKNNKDNIYKHLQPHRSIGNEGYWLVVSKSDDYKRSCL